MDNKRFGITQHKGDKYILEKILKSMNSTHRLFGSKIHNCFTFQIGSKIIVDDIKRLGGKCKKSLISKFPYVPKEYLPDFIRGLWDGDGCITFTKFRKCYTSNFVTGSKAFAYKFFDVLRSEIPETKGIVYESPSSSKRKNTLYSILFGKNDTIRLGKYMYQNNPSLFLFRKFEKFNITGEIVKQGQWKRYRLSFQNARAIVRKEKLKSVEDWRVYARTKRPKNIPSMPQQYYKNCGWTNWYDFLGKEKREKKEEVK